VAPKADSRTRLQPGQFGHAQRLNGSKHTQRGPIHPPGRLARAAPTNPIRRAVEITTGPAIGRGISASWTSWSYSRFRRVEHRRARREFGDQMPETEPIAVLFEPARIVADGRLNQLCG
jgi:hypothetical protein